MCPLKRNIFILAGEASGDMHASALVKDIRKIDGNILFSGIGGSFLKSENVTLFSHYNEINFIGLLSVLKNASFLKKKLNETARHILSSGYDAVILVDFPGFNLRLAEKIRNKYKGKIIYYISPQVWAWHKSRVKKIKTLIDLMLVVFPFEVDFYRAEGVNAFYVGHPLVSRIDSFLLKNTKQQSKLPVITLMPGSRNEEVLKILPGLVKTADLILQNFSARINILRSDNTDNTVIENITGGRNFEIVSGDNGNNYKTILNSDFVITKVGTSNLESGLLGTPFSAVYKAGKANYLIGRALINLDYISLVNIVLGKSIIREFIQSDFTPVNLFNETVKVLKNTEYRNKMKAGFGELRNVFKSMPVIKSAAEYIAEKVLFAD
ncbi:MAG: lipid-A-disaccharide synthase [Ignavibacteriae bacterium]|nr:lipid-A-disaccharide synthase [Ignavibacteriota bacterium]